MVFLRLITFVFMLMFTLLEARDLTNYKHNYQGLLDTKVAPQSKDFGARSTRPIAIIKETTSYDPETKEGGGSNGMSLKGRKLATKGRVSRWPKAEEGGAAKGRRSSEMSGATPSPWNCNHKVKGKLRISCNKQSVRSFSPPHKKAKFPTGFVALSADYNFPNSHPPRHN